MKVAVRNLILVNALWLVGLGALVVVLVGGPIQRIGVARDDVDRLQGEVLAQETSIARYPASAESLAMLTRLDQTLEDSRRLAASQSTRIAELSAAARGAGVTITALESLEPRPIDQHRVLSCSHRLVATGDYRQLAGFLQGIADGPGLCAIDELELTPQTSTPRTPLRASFHVTWYAPGPAAEAPVDEPEAP